MTLLLASIAGISLLVGGIGIMNIMLVSVTERTREIGIRKALGARRRDVLAQFLTEAIILSGIGGLLGWALGWGASRVISSLGTTTVVAPATVILAFGFSVAVGVFFGIYPGQQGLAHGSDPGAQIRMIDGRSLRNMNRRNRITVLATITAGFLFAAVTAGAQATGTATAQAGFNVENLLMELSNFLPEEYAGFGGRGFFVGGPNAGPVARLPAAPPRPPGIRPAGGDGQPAAPGIRHPRIQARREADADREAGRRAAARAPGSPEDALPHAVAGEEGHHDGGRDLDEAAEGRLRQVRQGAGQGAGGDAEAVLGTCAGQRCPGRHHGAPGGGTFTRENSGDGTGDGQRPQGQRQQMDPAELRKQMLEGFIKNLQDYRKGLK